MENDLFLLPLHRIQIGNRICFHLAEECCTLWRRRGRAGIITYLPRFTQCLGLRPYVVLNPVNSPVSGVFRHREVPLVHKPGRQLLPERLLIFCSFHVNLEGV